MTWSANPTTAELQARIDVLEDSLENPKDAIGERLQGYIYRLTALEAAKPEDAKLEDTDKQARELIAEIHSLEMDAYQAEGDLAELEAENAELARQRDNLRFALSAAADKIRRLTEGFYALEAQRNTLAAQVDDLRNVNAGLRKHNASQQDLLVSGRLRSLRRIEALLAVEWVTGECPWCGNSHREGHEEDCPRQAALR